MTAIICCQCGKQRGKYAKPWKKCSKCGNDLCLQHNMEECNKCWREEYDRKEQARKQTPVTCIGCENQFLPADLQDSYFSLNSRPAICKPCYRIFQNVKTHEEAAARRRNAKPGLVEVLYGVHRPTQDGGKGYAYRDPGLNLKLGDIVTLPPTWLDRDVHGTNDTHEGTVVSTYSDYSGAVSTIVKLVRRAEEALQ